MFGDLQPRKVEIQFDIMKPGIKEMVGGKATS
jgi:hypothetical protein